jgi:hypothetical protein
VIVGKAVGVVAIGVGGVCSIGGCGVKFTDASVGVNNKEYESVRTEVNACNAVVVGANFKPF